MVESEFSDSAPEPASLSVLRHLLLDPRERVDALKGPQNRAALIYKFEAAAIRRDLEE